MSHPPVIHKTATNTASPNIMPKAIFIPLFSMSPSFFASMNPIISMKTKSITMQTAKNGISLMTISLANGNAMKVKPITKLIIALICFLPSPSILDFSSIAKISVKTSKKGNIKSVNQGFENIVSTILF